MYVLVDFGLSDNDTIILVWYAIPIDLYYVLYYRYYLLTEIERLNLIICTSLKLIGLNVILIYMIQYLIEILVNPSAYISVKLQFV